MLILREEGIVRNLILVGVEELKINDAELKFHATSTLNVAQQSVALAMSTAAQLTCIRQATEDDSMHMEREAAIQWLSSLDVHQKQRRKFEERHKGTGRWFLQTNEFENWFSNPENSILWCHGDRKCLNLGSLGFLLISSSRCRKISDDVPCSGLRPGKLQQKNRRRSVSVL
jgi:hypothetical protein